MVTKTHHFLLSVAFSIHIACHVHTNDCFFNTFPGCVDGIDIGAGPGKTALPSTPPKLSGQSCREIRPKSR